MLAPGTGLRRPFPTCRCIANKMKDITDRRKESPTPLGRPKRGPDETGLAAVRRIPAFDDADRALLWCAVSSRASADKVFRLHGFQRLQFTACFA